jgi:hypothetical protein
MPAHRSAFVAIALLVALIPAAPAWARCVLPVPDGGGIKPSPANVYGRIATIENGEVFISQAKTGKLVRIVLPSHQKVFSAFGGDGSPSDLAPGQTVWVWLVGCKWPAAGRATSAYFQVYSTDPNDRP